MYCTTFFLLCAGIFLLEPGLIYGFDGELRDKTVDIDIPGTYEWELIMDYNNLNNSETVIYEKKYKASITASYESLVKNVYDYSLEAGLSSEVGAKFEIIDVSAKTSLNTKLAHAYESTINSKKTVTEETEETVTLKVGPHSTFKLYRLIFRGPGVVQSLDTTSSIPHKLDDVIITFKVRPKYFLQKINVVYTSEPINKPTNFIQEVDGLDADVNAGFGGSYVWLIPVWTTNSDEGITGIDLVLQAEYNPEYVDLAFGANGLYRYLKMLKDPNSRARITEIKLWRTKDASSYHPSKYGWSHYSRDLNQDRGGSFLYLVWKTVDV